MIIMFMYSFCADDFSSSGFYSIYICRNEIYLFSESFKTISDFFLDFHLFISNYSCGLIHVQMLYWALT